MKHLKFTYVDALTGISIATEPAMHGTKFPKVSGLEFAWARESAYPTPVPEFFGTCPDDSIIDVPGVLGVFVESDWVQMQQDEVRATSPVPKSVAMRQARLALLAAGLLDKVETAIASAGPAAKIEWDYATEVQRNAGLVPQMASALGLTSAQIDALFIGAAAL